MWYWYFDCALIWGMGVRVPIAAYRIQSNTRTHLIRRTYFTKWPPSPLRRLLLLLVLLPLLLTPAQ